MLEMIQNKLDAAFNSKQQKEKDECRAAIIKEICAAAENAKPEFPGAHGDDPDENPKMLEYFTKKNYFDATAALIYSLGCSLNHLVLAYGILWVQKSDVEAAKAFDL